MKKRRSTIVLVILLAIAICLVWWNRPSGLLKHVNPYSISLIEVRDGSTGVHFTIADAEDISYIVKNIQGKTFYKDGISLMRMGTLYTLSFYDEKDKEIDSFIINGFDTIRKDSFFYRASTADLCVDYIKTLEN